MTNSTPEANSFTMTEEQLDASAAATLDRRDKLIHLLIARKKKQVAILQRKAIECRNKKIKSVAKRKAAKKARKINRSK